MKRQITFAIILFSSLGAFAQVTQEDLDKIAWRLNTRPRKSLAWKCPAELFLPEDSFDFQAYWKSILQPNQPNVALGT